MNATQHIYTGDQFALVLKKSTFTLQNHKPLIFLGPTVGRLLTSFRAFYSTILPGRVAFVDLARKLKKYNDDDPQMMVMARVAMMKKAIPVMMTTTMTLLSSI